ncbi:alpha-amylase family glycosyl hydrolase [Niveibacterium terrae]|uniref:alpha-amylase family glycosyl hydrolase n=1 Tax=Niveibacterium terrae TaxID=3373598 RepID=UPI003A901A76
MSIKHRAGLALSLIASALLIACGGGGGDSSTTPVTPTDSAISISSVSGSTEETLPCNKGTSNSECALRTYQIMVESFIDGDSSADYNTGYGSSHHKGDLQGIIASLDYIKSTGVNAIWLTPIFKSTAASGQDQWADRLDATGYYTSDYFAIDPKFGTLAQAKTLVDEAHKRGLYVFFDGVFGHHKTNLVASPNGRLPVQTTTCSGMGGSNTLSGLMTCDDYSKAATLDFYNEVAAYWINTLGIDGWRLDQAYQVPLSAWRSLRTTVKTASAAKTYTNAAGATVNPLGYMVAEIWSGESDIATYGYGTTASPALNSAFDFPGRYRVVKVLATQEDTSASDAKAQAASLLKQVFSTHASYPDHAIPNLMLGNHDLVRFGDLIERAGYGGTDTTQYWQRHKLAFAFMAAYSGPVTLYYGDEIGQELANYSAKDSSSSCALSGTCDDHVSRTSGIVKGVPTTVGAAASTLTTQQQDLHDTVAALWALRDANPALAIGSRTHVYSDTTLYIDRKDAGTNHVLLAMNTGSSAKTVKIATGVVSGATSLTDLQSGASLSAASGVIEVTIPALSARLLKF